jgi:hypothetical protein
MRFMDIKNQGLFTLKLAPITLVSHKGDTKIDKKKTGNTR